MNKIRGLSLFSGYGGIDLALEEYVRPIMFCEIEKYCQGIILSRMDDGTLPFAPIWNDVTTLDGTKFRGLVDIVYGGFPCQDISVAGKGAGLAGKRSGLFSEIVRICKETSPQFIFLENVPAIRTRGSIEVQEALASIGYDARWITLSAAEVGANHKRERWFCLAYSKHYGHREQIQYVGEPECKESSNTRSNGEIQSMAHTGCKRLEGQWEPIGAQSKQFGPKGSSKNISNTNVQRQCRETTSSTQKNNEGIWKNHGGTVPSPFNSDWWKTEPCVDRVVDGCPARTHRIKALGNGVVPLQVKTAFEILIGISGTYSLTRKLDYK